MADEGSSGQPGAPNQWSLDGENLKEELHYTFSTECDEFKGDPNACFRLGEWYQVMNQNRDKAMEIYGENCEANDHAKSCFNKAAVLLGGSAGKAQEDNEAATLVKKACALGHTQACDTSASLMLQGVGGVKDFAGAIKALETACEANYSPSCFRLGMFYLTAFKQVGVERSPTKAKSLLEKGCRYGHPASCHTLAVMYKKGDGVPQDNNKFSHYAKLTKELIKATGEKLGVKVSGV
jgi:TPR repeat protein